MIQYVEQLDGQDPIHFGSPINPSSSAYSDDVVVIACERGRHCVIFDQQPACRVILFDWTGLGVADTANPHGLPVISKKTECKGELMEHAYLHHNLKPGSYMGFIDDDIVLKLSSLPLLLSLARVHQLLAVQPALSEESSGSDEYPFLRRHPSRQLHRVPIVEIMAPFIRSDLLARAMPFARGIKSGYGLDRFALPLCAHDLGSWRFAVIDSVVMSHVRMLSSVNKAFSHGLLAKQEELLVRFRLAASLGIPINDEIVQQAGLLEAAVSLQK
jgi:hypothetical protein